MKDGYIYEKNDPKLFVELSAYRKRVKEEEFAADYNAAKTDRERAVIAKLAIEFLDKQKVGKGSAKRLAWVRKAEKNGYIRTQTTPSAPVAPGASSKPPVADAQTKDATLQAAEQGDAASQFVLGTKYANGLGVPKDEAKAVYWFQKAAAQGNPGAQFNLGWRYGNGKGVPKDEAKAVHWYQKAAEQGNSEAQLNLGVMYANGQGVSKDEFYGVQWYKKAAAGGNARAQFFMGARYAEGNGVAKDTPRAFQWFQKAAAQGHAEAKKRLAQMKAVQTQYIAALQKTAEQGNVYVQYSLGEMYSAGQGVPEDYAKAAYWYQKAAEQGHVSAQKHLGLMYFLKDIHKTAYWYQKAAEQGNADAQQVLGSMYAKGSGVPKDEAKAAQWLQKAAAQGNADAQKKLERMQAAQPATAQKTPMPRPQQPTLETKADRETLRVANRRYVDAQGKPFTGIVRTKKQGKLFMEQTVIAGVEEGMRKNYHQNGKLLRETNYVNGKPDGPVIFYAKNGEEEARTSYAELQENMQKTLQQCSGKINKKAYTSVQFNMQRVNAQNLLTALHSSVKRYDYCKDPTLVEGVSQLWEAASGNRHIATSDEGGWRAEAEWYDPDLEKTFTNNIGMEMVQIPGGHFMMGSPPDPNKRFLEFLQDARSALGEYIENNTINYGEALFAADSKWSKERKYRNSAEQRTFFDRINTILVIIKNAFSTRGTYRHSIYPAFDDGIEAAKKKWPPYTGDDEMPRHRTLVSKPFYLGKYEVTQAQWEAVMGSNPSKFKAPNKPVEQVTWDDAQEFVRRLNAREGHKRYRLPTEAEWEYAARAGTNGVYSFGDDTNELSGYAWYDGKSGNTTHPVGQKKANPWGLYDVHGNVYEWVQDWYGEKYYADSPGTDPKGPVNGSYRVFRGGSWYSNAESCRSGNRSSFSPDNRLDGIGFRLALSPE